MIRQDGYIRPQRPRAEVGEPVTWRPSCFTMGEIPGAVREVHGRVIYINEAHRFYVAEARCGAYTLREVFKF